MKIYIQLITLITIGVIGLLKNLDQFNAISGFITGVGATFIGVATALQMQKYQKEIQERHEFESTINVLDFELEQNLSVIGKFRSGVTETSFCYGLLAKSVIDQLLQNITTIKYGGEVFHRALLFNKTRISSLSQVYHQFEIYAFTHKGLSKNEVDSFNDFLNQTEYMVGLLRALITKYEKDKKSLLKKETFMNLEAALKLEKQYREDRTINPYEKLKNEVRL